MKQCRQCKRLLAEQDFYAAPSNRDGLNWRCKTCIKGNVRKRYRFNITAIRAYDRQRNQRVNRRKAKVVYDKNYRMKHPQKYRANRAVAKAIEKGRLTRMPCAICDSPKGEAHHFDYSRPFDIAWLCLTHHRQVEGKLVA